MKTDKAPLYRKVNTRTHHVHHDKGGEHRHGRHGKAAVRNTAEGVTREAMHGKVQRGLDYTPLYRFLLSRVGTPWAEARREAESRLDRPDPIFWMVALREEDRRTVVRTGESSYFSGLYVDDDGLLQRVAPEITHETMRPNCECCTNTLNGQRLVRHFREGWPEVAADDGAA